MRRLVLVVAALLLAGCSATAPPSRTAPRQSIDLATPALVRIKQQAKIPDCPQGNGSNELPAVTLQCLGGGRAVALDRVSGPILVNFWQATCVVCREEMPLLSSYARQHAGVTVLGVDFQDQMPADALRLAARSGVDYPLVGDPLGDLDSNGKVPHVFGLPLTMLVDARGKVVAQKFGAFKSAAELQQFVAAYVPGA